MTQRDIFMTYLKSTFPDSFVRLEMQFDAYFNWLVDINQKINLFSRKTDPNELWTRHFLDSILLSEVTRFSNEYVCDFGTGGGLPGIPLALLYPEMQVRLLDGTRKKLDALTEACNSIGIDNCRCIHARIEEFPLEYTGYFDVIVSRSVKILPTFKEPLQRLLTPTGRLFLYKSSILDDTEIFANRTFHDLSRPEIGTRTIVQIQKNRSLCSL